MSRRLTVREEYGNYKVTQRDDLYSSPYEWLIQIGVA